MLNIMGTVEEIKDLVKGNKNLYFDDYHRIVAVKGENYNERTETLVFEDK